MQPPLPTPRGPISEQMCRWLRRRPRQIVSLPTGDDPPSQEDLQLALHVCFGLHYDGFLGVDEAWEFEPSVAGIRSTLEHRFLSSLISAVPLQARPGVDGRSPLEQVRLLLEAGAAEPSLSQFMVDHGTVDQFREFVVHRSIYQRKEADPHTWAIPRLRGRAKSAMVTLQSDEYGNGRPGKSHAELFADTMLALDLNPAPGAYIDQIPAVSLATDNLVSMFGRHRRWRGALVGHLAVFEMTSVTPMSRYAAALRRMKVPESAVEFYDVHVAADVLHARIAADDLVVGLTESDPDAAVDVPFGAASLLEVESRFSHHLLTTWASAQSSLRPSSSPGWLPIADRVLMTTGGASAN